MPPPELSANEIDDYEIATSLGNSVQKEPFAAEFKRPNKNLDAPRSKNLRNSKYVYAISPIALATFWDEGGRQIARSKPLSMIFTILSHRLNTTDVRNYPPWPNVNGFVLTRS